MSKIIFNNKDGVPSIATVVDGIDINEEIKKFPDNAFIVEDSELVPPNEHSILTITDGSITWEDTPLDTHRTSRLALIRNARDSELTQTDKKWVEFASKGDTKEKGAIEVLKQTLRNIPQLYETKLNEAGTVEAIKAIWPDELSDRKPAS